MPRQARVVAVDVPHHITHRGNNRQDVFLTDEDRRRYQEFVSESLEPCRAELLGWCWMSNHVHLIVVPRREDSLATALLYVDLNPVRAGITGEATRSVQTRCGAA